ncbi:MAG: hypothetical protein ACAH10_00995 [Methylophilaceae bacterium]
MHVSLEPNEQIGSHKHSLQSAAISKPLPMDSNAASSSFKNKQPEHPIVENQSKDSSFDGYFSTRDIERKALPVSNIDLSMLSKEFISGLPIRLRLYISASGRVAKIDKLEVLPQDEEFALSIEDLLYQTTFLAAKKDGLDVPSYQDIEFSFSALPK